MGDNEFKGSYEDGIKDIKRRKRLLRWVGDASIVKKMKNDLRREQRGLKRSDKNKFKVWVLSEIDK